MSGWNDPVVIAAVVGLIFALTNYVKSLGHDTQINSQETRLAVTESKISDATNGSLDSRIEAVVTRALNARLGPQGAAHVLLPPVVTTAPSPLPPVVGEGPH